MSLPSRVAAAFEVLRRPRQAPEDGPDLRWAHRIIARHEAGESVKSATLQMAREALGLPTTKEKRNADQ
jgi:hypothetical protein